MTLRITRDDGVPEGLLEGFPYREIREEEERRSASSRWPLLAAVDRQVREAEQRSFLRNRGPEESADDTVGDEKTPVKRTDPGMPVPVAQGTKPRRG